jgi:hypothetical protein
MRCYICDTELSDTEVQHSEDPKHSFEPCKTCDDISFDAAYSGGFDPEAFATDVAPEPELLIPPEIKRLSDFT